VPIYSYKCEDCETIVDEYRSIRDRDNCPTCECGGSTKKIITSYFAHGDIEPYLDPNISDKPTWVKSKKHRRQLMEENGVIESYGKGWK